MSRADLMARTVSALQLVPAGIMIVLLPFIKER